MLGLTGANGTGKTTLARAFAEKMNIPFIQTGTSEVFARLGKDPKVEYPVDERLAIQEAILFAIEAQYKQARDSSAMFIADRTPIDLASYMISDVQRSTFKGMNPNVALMVNDYVRRCITSTNKWFSTVVLVQPGIALIEREGKAPACPAYMEHLNLVQTGLMLDESLKVRHYMIPRRFTSMEDRIDSLKQAMAHAYNREAAERQLLEENGFALH